MYVPGDYNVICDKCGMKRHASQCQFQWDGLFVCKDCFDERHPQDFVTGVEDDQTVSVSRPDVIQSIGQTTVGVAAVAGALTISLASVTGIADEDVIGVTLDDGTIHWTFSDGDPAVLVVTLGSYLPGPAAVDNIVYLPSINNETFTTPTSITGSDL